MLNLMRDRHRERQLARRELFVAAGLGLLLGMFCVGLQEAASFTELALETASETTTDRTLIALQPEAAAARSAAEKTRSERLAQKVFLEQRQAARDDVTDVQQAWLLSHFGTEPASMKLQAQSWQQGQLTWEGVAAQVADVEAVVKALNRVPRWVQAPMLVQIQTPPDNQGASPRQGFVFQLQGRLHPAKGGGT